MYPPAEVVEEEAQPSEEAWVRRWVAVSVSGSVRSLATEKAMPSARAAACRRPAAMATDV